MASSSQVESIFFAALEKKTGAERADYLDRACGGDAALRLRVEPHTMRRRNRRVLLPRAARKQAQAIPGLGPT
jgi:hypothetical protein